MWGWHGRNRSCAQCVPSSALYLHLCSRPSRQYRHPLVGDRSYSLPVLEEGEGCPRYHELGIFSECIYGFDNSQISFILVSLLRLWTCVLPSRSSTCHSLRPLFWKHVCGARVIRRSRMARLDRSRGIHHFHFTSMYNLNLLFDARCFLTTTHRHIKCVCTWL